MITLLDLFDIILHGTALICIILLCDPPQCIILLYHYRHRTHIPDIGSLCLLVAGQSPTASTLIKSRLNNPLTIILLLFFITMTTPFPDSNSFTKLCTKQERTLSSSTISRAVRMCVRNICSCYYYIIAGTNVCQSFFRTNFRFFIINHSFHHNRYILGYFLLLCLSFQQNGT